MLGRGGGHRGLEGWGGPSTHMAEERVLHCLGDPPEQGLDDGAAPTAHAPLEGPVPCADSALP